MTEYIILPHISPDVVFQLSSLLAVLLCFEYLPVSKDSVPMPCPVDKLDITSL